MTTNQLTPDDFIAVPDDVGGDCKICFFNSKSDCIYYDTDYHGVCEELLFIHGGCAYGSHHYELKPTTPCDTTPNE